MDEHEREDALKDLDEKIHDQAVKAENEAQKGVDGDHPHDDPKGDHAVSVAIAR